MGERSPRLQPRAALAAQAQPVAHLEPTRRRSAGDRRVQHAFLTQRARDLRLPAIEAASGVNAMLLASLSDDERHQFIALMRKIIAAEGQRAAD